MPKFIPIASSVKSTLFWSVISAAFIGPGTVTTAAAAGAQYGLDLLWALTYATIVCIVLQESAARITIASGHSLGEVLLRQYSRTAYRRIAAFSVAGAIVFGCAAYQAGNILGAVSGLRLLLPVSPALATVGITGIGGLLLWMGNYRLIAHFLGIIVGIMGVVFMAMALQLPIPFSAIVSSAFVPRVPGDASLLIIGLIGTTVVPYNLFLGSGISQGQRMSDMRIGITVAVLIGGIISMAILVVGSAITETFSYEALVRTMTALTGDWAAYLFGIGLFAAGFSSAITAPLAAAITVQSVRASSASHPVHRTWPYRMVWLSVLAVGFGFGIANVKPIPVIILAQGINGVLLPLVTVFLLLAVNDPTIMPRPYRNSWLLNGIMLLIVGTTTLLGLTNLVRAVIAAFPTKSVSENVTLPYVLILSTGVTIITAYAVYRRRMHNHPITADS